MEDRLVRLPRARRRRRPAGLERLPCCCRRRPVAPRSSNRSADSMRSLDRARRRADRLVRGRPLLEGLRPARTVCRRRRRPSGGPGCSVTSIRPSGRKAMPHGFCRPSATVTTSNATFALRSGARVCPGKAGVWPVAFGGRVSTDVLRSSVWRERQRSVVGRRRSRPGRAARRPARFSCGFDVTIRLPLLHREYPDRTALGHLGKVAGR